MQTFFAPGRTELAGNHTDHQNGRVLAAAVDLGITAQMERREDLLVQVASEGYPPFTVDLTDTTPHTDEIGSSAALVRGVAAAIQKRGGSICGFDAHLTSTLPEGGGLSSSAAFEILIGRIWNALCNSGRFTPVELAQIGQEAENVHFGKPSGLMDQLACSMGGIIYVDFATMEIRPIRASFEAMGCILSLTDTGGSHAGLTEDYAAIPADMRSVARHFGRELLSEVTEEQFLSEFSPFDDRLPILRAAHFFSEQRIVPAMAEALEDGDPETYISLMKASGFSSQSLLRNIRSPHGDDRLEQGLKLAGELLRDVGGWRVHGGGFAGSVQAVVPASLFPVYRLGMEQRFGAGKCREISISAAAE